MVKDALSQVVLHKINAEKGEGPDLEEKYEIQGYPTFVLLDGEGRVVSRWMGYDSPDSFKRFLELNLADPVPLDEKYAAFEAEPTAVRAEILGQISASSKKYEEAVSYYRKVGELSGEDGPDLVLPILDATYSGYRMDRFTAEQVLEAAEQVHDREGNTAMDWFTVAYYTTALGKKEGSTDPAVPYIERAMAVSGELGDDPDMKRYKDWISISHALYVEKDTGAAVELKRGTLPEGWMDDADELNGFAWWCFQNEVNLEEAEALARKAVDMAEPGEEKAAVLDTVAEIVNARGNPEEAATLIEQALAEAPEDENLLEKLQKFRGGSGIM